jgi:hypothetical protein
VTSGYGDGARLMRASFELVRSDLSLLWFPVISTCCLAAIAGFWIFEGAWLYAINGPWVFYVPLVAIGISSVVFVGIFLNVALAGATAQLLNGEEPTVRDGLDIAWSRLGGIAGWAGFSLVVALFLSVIESIKGLRWVGKAAEVAWGFATIFVVPLIAVEGLDSEGARRRSFQLVKENWKTESGGLVALRAALLVPGLPFYLDARLLFGGHVHTPTAKALLGFLLLCGFGLFAAVGVVRQVFAVELYRSASR